MKKCSFLFFLTALIFLTFSCKKKEITPAYLVLTEDDFKDCIENDLVKFNKVHEKNTLAPYDDEGYAAIRQQHFRDVLVSLNGKSLGYWRLPCRIPLLPNYSSINNIRIIPCVRVPGISLTAVPYYFLEPTPKELFLEIEKGKEYRKSDLSDLKYEYVAGVDFPLLETFSKSYPPFKPHDTIKFPTPMNVIPDAELGKNVGVITLEDSVSFFNVVTSFFNLSGSGVRHFWEMHYKCESGEMTTYLNFQNTSTGVFQQDLIVFPATSTWKKAYIDLTDVISRASESAYSVSICLGIRGYKSGGAKKATFYFDNIKIISMYAPY